METTTIALKRETFTLLKEIKESEHIDNYDQLIKKMILKEKRTTKSFFGKFRNLKEFKREEIDRFN